MLLRPSPLDGPTNPSKEIPRLMFKPRYFMLLAALLILPAIACGGSKKSDGDAASSAGRSSATPEATRSAAGAGGNELAGLAQGFSRVKSFRATLVMELPGQPPQNGVI